MIQIILNKIFPPIWASDILEKQIERTKMDLLTHLEIKQHSTAMVDMLQKRLSSLQSMKRSDKWNT